MSWPKRNLNVERTALEKAAQPAPSGSQVDQEIGDFYAAYMDEKGIDQKGVSPIKNALDSIGGLSSKDQLAASARTGIQTAGKVR